MPTHPIKTQDCLPARPGGLAGGQQVSDLDEIHRLQLVNGPMVNIFELTRGDMFVYDPKAKATRIAIRGPKARDWVSYPNHHWCGSTIGWQDEWAWKGFERVSSWLGKRRSRPDLCFSAAASPGRFKNTRWLGLDFDFADPPHPPDELMLEMLVDPAALSILAHYLEPHWMFTGGRSIHAHMFFEQAIPKETGRRLLGLLGQLLFPAELLSGADNNLTNCLRLPLSKHHATGGLARYAGCRNENDVADYIEAIERDDVGEDEIEDLLIELEDLLVNCGGQRPKKRRRVEPAQRKTLDTVSRVIKQSTSKQSTSHSAPCSPTKPAASAPAASALSALPDNIRQAAATVPWLVNHPRRQEFLTYIRGGIPQGLFQDIVYSSPNFLTFVMIACGDRDRAYELLLDVAAKGVDPKRAANRLNRLRATFHNFWPDFQDRGSGHNLEKLDSPEWIREAVKRLRQRFMDDGLTTKRANGLTQTAQFCLLLLSRFPDGATIGVRDLAAKRDITIKTASEHLRLLRTSYPLLELYRREQYDPSQPELRKAREWLLHREFVTRVLGVSLAHSAVPGSASTVVPAVDLCHPSTGMCGSFSEAYFFQSYTKQVFSPFRGPILPIPRRPQGPVLPVIGLQQSPDHNYMLCSDANQWEPCPAPELKEMTPVKEKKQEEVTDAWSACEEAKYKGCLDSVNFTENVSTAEFRLDPNVEQSTILQERKSWIRK